MKKPSRKLKQFPVLRTDEEAEKFVATADLSEYDFSQFKPVRFEFEPKAARVNMRLPESLIKTLKERAKKRGVPYQRFMREMIELGLSSSERRKGG
ncbi:MAG: BrnA antitoxin family protein [Bauldia sp.]